MTHPTGTDVRSAAARRQAASDPSTDKDELSRLLTDEDAGVRQLAQANPAARNLTPRQ